MGLSLGMKTSSPSTGARPRSQLVAFDQVALVAPIHVIVAAGTGIARRLLKRKTAKPNARRAARAIRVFMALPMGLVFADLGRIIEGRLRARSLSFLRRQESSTESARRSARATGSLPTQGRPQRVATQGRRRSSRDTPATRGRRYASSPRRRGGRALLSRASRRALARARRRRRRATGCWAPCRGTWGRPAGGGRP